MQTQMQARRKTRTLAHTHTIDNARHAGFQGENSARHRRASGIGRATALALAKEGADLVLCDVDEKGLAQTAESIRAIGRNVFWRKVDVSSREAMRELAAEVHEEIGALDVLVNNAGVARRRSTIGIESSAST